MCVFLERLANGLGTGEDSISSAYAGFRIVLLRRLPRRNPYPDIHIVGMTIVWISVADVRATRSAIRETPRNKAREQCQ